MKNEINTEDVKTISEAGAANNTTNEIVIPDECGDSMWDAVLAQQCKTTFIKSMAGKTKLY